jgi:2-polyprenyl-3-methyl-5-hydroxy-6-metoxy-1,4-benzoquinol methylase
MSIEFDKYERFGAYHWKEFYEPSEPCYRAHAIHVLNWVGSRHGKILDVGCGDGLIAFLLGAKGIDNHELAVSMAQERGVDARVYDVYDLAELGEEYDSVYLGDTIEHLEYPEKAMRAIQAVTNEVFIATPPAREDGVLHDPYHYREYTPDQLKDFMVSLGWMHLNNFKIENYRIYGHFWRPR